MEDCLDSLRRSSILLNPRLQLGLLADPTRRAGSPEDCVHDLRRSVPVQAHSFGLCNAPATYQRTFDIFLAGPKWQSCLVYVDDVIVFSKSFGQHLTAVADALHILQEAGLSMNMLKCKFFRRTVDYFGHVMHPGRLAVAEKNTEAVKKAKYPGTQIELRSFLGTCNVYRRFVPSFEHVAAPLNQLLTKGQDS